MPACATFATFVAAASAVSARAVADGASSAAASTNAHTRTRRLCTPALPCPLVTRRLCQVGLRRDGSAAGDGDARGATRERRTVLSVAVVKRRRPRARSRDGASQHGGDAPRETIRNRRELRRDRQLVAEPHEVDLAAART